MKDKYQTNPNQIIQIPTLSTTVNDPYSLITSWFCDCGVPLSNENVTNEKGKQNSRNWKYIHMELVTISI